jgi:hypothetical protein
MLSNEGDNYGALPPRLAEAWAVKNGVPFLTGEQVQQHILPPSEAAGEALKASNGVYNGVANGVAH